MNIGTSVTGEVLGTFDLIPASGSDGMVFNLTPVKNDAPPATALVSPTSVSFKPVNQKYNRQLSNTINAMTFTSPAPSITPDFTGLLPPPPPLSMENVVSSRPPPQLLSVSRTSKEKKLMTMEKSDSYRDTNSSSSINMSSNRISVIRTQSNSSESYEQDTSPNSVSDNGVKTQTSSTESRPATSQYIPSCREQEMKALKAYHVVENIVTSEKTYVKALKLINIDFKDKVEKSGILPDHPVVKLFSNLPELMMLNEELLRDFQERINNWESHKKIADVIIKKGPRLKLYIDYIRNFSAMNFHFDECTWIYNKFEQLVKEYEKKSKSLNLKDFMLKPVQRLPQYKLLLEDYLKHLDTDSIDWVDASLALDIVSDAFDCANSKSKLWVSGQIFMNIILHLLK